MSPANQPSFVQRRAEVGARLNAARIDQQLSVQHVAARLRTTRSLIERLENGDWGVLGAGAYGRGFARSYARLVGIELGNLDGCLEPPESATELEGAAQTRRRRQQVRGMQRFAAYTAATALIAVPLVFLLALAFRGQPLPVPALAEQQAVLASLVPQSQSQAGLILTARSATEVSVQNESGGLLWHGVIEAQASRYFSASDGLIVRFDNPDSIEATLHGKPLALAPYRIQQAVELRVPATASR